MLKSLSGCFIFFCCLSLCGCAKKVYTHQQVMQSFHTKGDVLKRFGKPDQIKEDTLLDEWTYNRDGVDRPVKAGTGDTISAAVTTSDTLKTNKIVKYNKYIRFIFDKDGNIAGYKSKGVDLTQVTTDSFGLTVLKVLGITALLVIVIGVDIYNNTDVNL